MTDEQPKVSLALLRHPIVVGVALIVLFGVLSALAGAREVFLIGFLSVLVANVLVFPIRLFSRWMPRGVATVLSLLLLTGLIAAMLWLTIPPMIQQGKQLIERLPEAFARLESWVDDAKRNTAVGQVPGAEQITDQLKERVRETVESGLRKLMPAVFGIASGLLGVVLLLIMAAFLAHQPGSYRDGVRVLVPRKYEKQFDETWRRLGQGLRAWIRGIVISMTIMGVFTGVLLMLAGIQGWFLLATLTFLGTFIPYLGAIATSVPGLLMGLAQSPTHFFYACAIYVGVHMVEGYIVQPLIMKRAVEIKPGLLLFWQALMGALFGVLGIIVATPLLVCVQIAVGYLYVENQLRKRALAATVSG
jgi:predicted PurR-regulated permease PerM